MDFIVKTKCVEIVEYVPGLYNYLFSLSSVKLLLFLLLNYILFNCVNYISLLICVIYTTTLYLMLIFPVPIIHNLLAKLALKIVLLVTLHYCV